MSSELTPLLLLVVLLVVFWLVVLRPARNQQRTQQALQRSLEVGDDVVLSSGIFGTVTAIEDTQVRLEVAPGTVVRVARQVVVRRVEDEAAAPVAADAEGENQSVTPEIFTEQPADVVETVPAEEAATTAPDEVKATETPATTTPAEKAPAKKTSVKKTSVKKASAKKAAAKKTVKKAPTDKSEAEPEPAPEPEDAERG